MNFKVHHVIQDHAVAANSFYVHTNGLSCRRIFESVRYTYLFLFNYPSFLVLH